MAMLTSDRGAAPADVVAPEVTQLEFAQLEGAAPASAPESPLVRRIRLSRLVNGAPTNWSRVAFFVVLTVFVSTILASYAVPLWFITVTQAPISAAVSSLLTTTV